MKKIRLLRLCRLIKRIKTNDNIDILIAVGSVFMIMCAMWMFTGQWFFRPQPYNSYILQAKSWLEGRLHLRHDIPYLELAIFKGNYYVSFPPFPSYLMLPFVALGIDNCDGFIALASALTGVVYAMKIMHKCDKHGANAIILTFLLTIGSNWLYTSNNAWVWFIAQNLAFTLSLMAIYYAMCGKAGLSLTFWGCAVGCRPFQVIYIFVLAYLLYDKFKTDNQDITVKEIIRTKWLCGIPVFIIALSYMILNYARFGSIVEFGHNYLPEFMRVNTGQFNIAYMPENLYNLFRMPEIRNGVFRFPMDNGFNIFMSSPIFYVALITFMYGLLDIENKHKPLYIITIILVIIHLLALTAHKTMGGAHFGNRYPCDTLPFIFASLALIIPKNSKAIKLCMLPLMFGFALNIIGTVTSFINQAIFLG